jgi:PAS domain S-box-containing protein
MKRPARFSSSNSPLLICVLYFAASCLWIVFTDQLLAHLPLGPDAVTRWGMAKGLFFVLASAVLIYGALRRVSKVNAHLEALVASRTSALATSEQDLHRSEERLRMLLASLPDVTWTTAASGQTIYISPNVERIIGYTEKEIYERGEKLWSSRIHPDDRQRVIDAFHELFSEGRSFDVEYRIQCKDASWIWIYDRAITTHEEGGVWYADGIFSDITERKEAEEARRTIIQAALDGFYLVSMQGKLLEVNDAYCAMSGYSREELLQMSVRDLECQENAAEVAEHMERLTVEHSGRFETRHRRKSGEIIDIETSVTFQRGRFACFLRNLTDRKRSEKEKRALEEQLQHAQKMEAVGRLAGGVAHDFNNLLMVIQSYTELVCDSLPAGDQLRQYAQQVLKATDRGASLTRQMLAFGRKQMLSPVVLDLSELIDETVRMLKRLIGEDIEVIVNSADSLWAIEADPDQMVQVLMNLCVNARDAMPQGGNLTLTTNNVKVDDSFAATHEYISHGDYVMLSVTDTGQGMSKQVQDRLFEPFFTTKGVGKGTGLGLATVYGIVKQSNGYVWFNSELEQGTTCTIYLPRVQQPVATTAVRNIEQSQRGTETLLVVEDEQALREAVCEFLRSLGYDVLAADSGQHALSIASLHNRPVDVLVTDVVMPGMSGRQISQILGSLLPALKTIYMSGYTDDAVVRHGIRESAVAFLQKPFSLATLARKVREVIGQPA